VSRTVIVGDVHGCVRELEDLLSYVGLCSTDQLVFVGDLVVRGPKPHEVLTLARSLGALAVRGNHEDRLLRWRRAKGTGHPMRIGGVTRRTAEALKSRDWEFIEAMPLWLDLPAHGVRIVHAGVVPGVPIEKQVIRHLMYLRGFSPGSAGPGSAGPGSAGPGSAGPRMEAVEVRGTRSWAHAYGGPEHIVYGHNAQPEPEIAVHATGIDTGVVYGGRLTAMILLEAEHPPPPHERRRVLVSVPARQVYYDKDRRPPNNPAAPSPFRSPAARSPASGRRGV